MAQTLCPLCSQPSEITKVPDHDQFSVVCPHCLHFTISGDLIRVFALARQADDRRVLDQLADLSGRARATCTEGGNLALTTAVWEAEALEHRVRSQSKSS